MDGRIDAPIQLAFPDGKAPSKLQVRLGQILSVRVVQYLGRGRYSATVGGNTLVIRSAVQLPVGRLLRARVVATGKRIELKTVPAAEPMIRADGPPFSDGPIAAAVERIPREAVMLLLQSMRRSGLPVTPESMMAINAMIPQSRRKDPGFIRFATILFDKHLHADPERVEEFYLVVSGREHRGSGHDDGRREGEQGSPRGKRQTSTDPPPLGRAPASPRGTAEGAAAPGAHAAIDVRGQLKAQLRARGAGEAGWNALFNQRRGDHATWIIVPFRIGSKDAPVEGSIRLLVDSRGPSSPRASLRISRAAVIANGVAAFELSGTPPRRLVFHADPGPVRSEISRLLPDLKEKLRNLGVEIDDIIKGGADFDGFTADMTEIRGVDATA